MSWRRTTLAVAARKGRLLMAQSTAQVRTTPLVEVVIGEQLDAGTAGRLRRLLAEALELRPERLVIDLRDCPFVDATAVNVLLDTHRELWRTGGRLTLRSPSPRLRRLLELTHVSDVFDIAYGGPTQPPLVARTPARNPERNRERNPGGNGGDQR
jgi:anti-anti-sigma factor